MVPSWAREARAAPPRYFRQRDFVRWVRGRGAINELKYRTGRANEICRHFPKVTHCDRGYKAKFAPYGAKLAQSLKVRRRYARSAHAGLE
ncbi:hypothetical protein VT84_33885 [Gemmata sp. SH-PL17]|nr:hypothetical protein VT84_33885 [Gemmata sp. SH-PL17]